VQNGGLYEQQPLPPFLPALILSELDSATPEEGLTPLHMASANNNTKIAAALVAHGAEVNATTSLGDTPLHYAVETQDPELVELLCKAGAAVHVRSRRGGTPLQLAEKANDTQLIKILSQYRTRDTKTERVQLSTRTTDG